MVSHDTFPGTRRVTRALAVLIGGMSTTPAGAVGIDDANPFGPCWTDTLSSIDHRATLACMAPAVDVRARFRSLP